MIRIAVVGTRGFPEVQGGIESHCENLYTNLAKMGCEIIVFTREAYVDKKIQVYKGVSLIPVTCPKKKYFETVVHTFKSILKAGKYKPDILHIHGIGPSLFMPLAQLLGLRVVMTNHGPDYKWTKIANVVLKLGESLGSRWADDIICVSETIAEDIRRKYKRDVTVIPNGVIISNISKNDVVLKKYGLIEGKYILSVGRFVPEKGFHVLIDAFKKIEHGDWKLVIAGRADHEDKYSLALKSEASKNSNVILTGFLKGEPLKGLYSNAGLFVLSSYYEGLPIVLLEAMSYGLSCIASDIPANRNVELSGDRYFKAGDINALSEKINEFIGKKISEEEKKVQLKIINEKYSWEKIANMTLEVYKRKK